MHARCLNRIIVNHPAHNDNYKGNCSSYCNFAEQLATLWRRYANKLLCKIIIFNLIRPTALLHFSLFNFNRRGENVVKFSQI